MSFEYVRLICLFLLLSGVHSFRLSSTESTCIKCCLFTEQFHLTASVCQPCHCRLNDDWCSTDYSCADGFFCDNHTRCKPCYDCSATDACSEKCQVLSYNNGSTRQTDSLLRFARLLGSDLYARAILMSCPMETRVTTFGCPCTATGTRMICPAGSTCKDNICVVCDPGLYCPLGTIGPKPCPQGYFCPNSTAMLPCPQGSFCPEASTTPFSCNYTRLFYSTKYITFPKETVLTRVVNSNDPINGNTCPANSIRPNMICPAGHYCPNQTIIPITCPAGSYCRAQSSYPTRCPILTRCKTGTAQPTVSYVILILPVAFAILILARYSRGLSIWFKNKCSRAQDAYSKVEIVLSNVNQSYEEEDVDHDPHIEIMKWISTDNTKIYQDIIQGKVDGIEIDPNVGSMARYGGFIEPVESFVYSNVSARAAAASAPWLAVNTASFSVRRLNAVMGSSGCGKSTLIEMIRGRVYTGTLTGKIQVRHKREDIVVDYSVLDPDQLTKMRHLIGFVPQDDTVFGELTVRENILFASRLKLPHCRQDMIRDITSSTLVLLGFADAGIQNRLVGTVEHRGISGGQRKRVNIGMEAVGLHPILMMDEPTSGLDSTSSYQLLHLAKSLTLMGITVIAVVHQPRYSSFMLFDNLIIMNKYGTVFSGSPTMAIVYFEMALNSNINPDDNPADVLIDILTQPGSHAYTDTWHRSGEDWVRTCNKRYPCLHDMLNNENGFSHDKALEMYIKSLDPHEDNTLHTLDLVKLFDSFGANCAMKQLTNFMKDQPSITNSELARAIMHACNEESMTNRYNNILSKCRLLKNVPPRIMHATDTQHVYKTIGTYRLVIRFCDKLLARCNMHYRRHRLLQHLTHSRSTMTDEVLLLALCIKGKIKERVNDGIAFKLQQIEESYPIPNSELHKPGRTYQLWIIMTRKLLSIYRSPFIIQLMTPFVAAIIVGTLHGADWRSVRFANNIAMANVCVGVLSMVTHIRTFSMDKVMMHREIYANVSVTSYYVAYNLADILWLVSIPMCFFLPYYYLVFPLSNFWWFFLDGFLICFWSSGLAYVISALPIALHWANLLGASISIIFGAFMHGLSPTIQASRGGILHGILYLSYNRWATEGIALRELSHWEGTAPNEVYGFTQRIGYCDQGSLSMSPLMFMLSSMGHDERPILKQCQSSIRDSFLWLIGLGLIFRLLSFLMIFSSYMNKLM